MSGSCGDHIDAGRATSARCLRSDTREPACETCSPDLQPCKSGFPAFTQAVYQSELTKAAADSRRLRAIRPSKFSNSSR